MQFACYTDWRQLPGNADELFAHAEKDNLFYSRPWFENLSMNLDDEQALVLACVVSGNRVLAILPLTKSDGHYYSALRHRYTTHYSLLLADDNRDQALACLASGLSQLPLRSLLLEPVADHDHNILGLQHALEATGFTCQLHFRAYNWIYRVRGESYRDYLASRPAQLRNTLARKKRKLEREHGYRVRLFRGNEEPAAMPGYYSVYSASWKANEQYIDFLDSVVAVFSHQGWSRLAILYIDEQPVAAQLWFVLHGKASIFRLAYDQAWKAWSPGTILTAFLMEYVIDTDKVTEIDFLTGNDSYKQDWMSHRRERYALSCVRNNVSVNKHLPFISRLKQWLGQP